MEFVPVVALLRQVFSKIPKEHLVIPSGANTATLLLPVEDTELRIIGYETDDSGTTVNSRRRELQGTIIISYEGYVRKKEQTFIATYNLSTKSFTFLCSVPLASVVGASFWNPLLIFTQLDENNEFQSFLYNNDTPGSKPKQFLPATLCFEKIHFIAPRYFIQLRESTVKEQNTFPNARVCEIAPDMQVSVVKSFGNSSKYIWMDWDVLSKKLYLIERNPDKISSLLNDLLLVPLTRVPKPETKPLTKLKECTLSVINPLSRTDEMEEFQLQLDLSEAISSRKLGTNHDNRVLPVFSRFFSMVRTNQNQYCLCHQHPFIPGDITIRASVYMLNREEEITVSIPITHIDPTKLGFVRVFFTSIYEMVAIIIPGVFLFLIDGTKHRETYPSILLNDPSEFVKCKQPISVDSITRLHCKVSTGESLYLVIDGSNGICYEGQIGRLWIVNQFSKTFMRETQQEMWQDNEQLLEAMHLALFHLGDQDDELFLQIISIIFLGPRHLCNDSIDKEILKEILICYVYNEVRKIKGYDILLSIIPVTSLCQLRYWNHPMVDVQLSSRENLADIPYRLTARIQRYENHHKRATSISARKLPERGSFSSHIPHSAQTIHDAVIHHLAKELSYEKKQAHKLATSYCFLLMNSVEVIFNNYIMKGKNSSETPAQFFQLLMNFYSALEELSFPIAGSFNQEFITAAFNYLPRQIFGQHLEQGIFTITRNFLEYALPKLDETNKAEKALKLSLFASVEYTTVSDIAEKQEELVPFIFDRMLDEHTKSHELIFRKETVPTKSHFVPLDIVKNSLQTDAMHSPLPDFIQTHSDIILTPINFREL